VNNARTMRKVFTVEETQTARNVRSGDADVLATPFLAAFMEEVSNDLARKLLETGKISVGTHIDLYHTAPAYIGEPVEVESRLLHSDGRRLLFFVRAESGGKMVGYGIHERAVVEADKFSKRI